MPWQAISPPVAGADLYAALVERHPDSDLVVTALSELAELYQYYKDPYLLQLRMTTDSKLLAVFRVGDRVDDVKVFVWNIDQRGHAQYIDNRGDILGVHRKINITVQELMIHTRGDDIRSATQHDDIEFVAGIGQIPNRDAHLLEARDLFDDEAVREVALIDDAHRLVLFRVPDRLQFRFLRHASSC